MLIRTNAGAVANHPSILPRGAVLLLGYFDGFHRGHRALAAEAYRLRDQYHAPAVAVWTFDHLPGKGRELTDNEEKADAFFSYTTNPADGVVFEEFEAVSHLTGPEFVALLHETFGPCALVCGFNYRFGKGGAWTASDLVGLCGPYGMACSVVPACVAEGAVVSSTRIRELIERGDAEDAMHLMGRPYAVTAPVVHGKRLGHTLGFPTVNQRIPGHKVFPGLGIYACRVKLPSGGVKNGVCNIGSRPTVNSDGLDVTLETYIFDFDGELYGEVITVYLYKKLRDERPFPSVAALSGQISRDKAASAKYFYERSL